MPPKHPSQWPQVSETDKRLSDKEFHYITKQYLRPDQLDNPKLLVFIASYMENRHQAQAARDAGLDGKGSYLRSRPEIHACIEALTAKAVQKFGFDASEVIERMKEIGIVDPLEFENPDGSYKTHLSMVSPEVRRAIKEFTVKNIFGTDANGMPIVVGQLINVKLHDKLKGLELLGREKNIFKETKVLTHDVTSNMASLLLASKERANAREVGEVLEVTGTVENEED